MMLCLAYILEESIPLFYDDTKIYISDHDYKHLTSFQRYFGKNYLEMTNHRIGSPRIPIKFWNA
jgi:predicted ABC-class ATPase